MNGDYIKVYNYLNSIEKLNASIYSNLLSIYGELLVNKVIDDMIEYGGDNLVKFDYYITKIISYNEVTTKSLIESYNIDISLIPMLSKDENIKLCREISLIIDEIRNLYDFETNDDRIKFDNSWIRDNVWNYLLSCKDIDKLNKMNELYKKFIIKRNILVEGNLRLVILVAKKFNINESTFIEAIQLGNIGLMRAVEKVNPSFNISFSTYAYYWINQAITRGIYDVIYPYSIPEYQIGVYHSYKKIRKKLYDSYGREPSSKEIANEMGVSVKKIELLQTVFNAPLSLYETYGTDEEKDTRLIEFIEDRNNSISKDINYLELSIALDSSMDLYLSESEKIVLMNRFGFINGNCDTLEVIAKKIGKTRERVRQIEGRALRKLRVKCGDFEEYL